jgi:uncharacterized membrane protein
MVKPILNKKELEEVKEAVKAAELQTSGEIRVSVFKDFPKELRKTEPEEALRTLAHQQFVELGITNTKLDNGVLILLVVKPRRFIIWGDTGVNDIIPEGKWQELAGQMSSFFRENRFKEGLCQVVTEVGRILKEHFPYQKDDIDELPDEVHLG